MNHRRIILLAIGISLAGCGRSSPQSFPSPDGRRTVTAAINPDKSDPRKYLCIRLVIADALGKIEFDHQTGASATMRWSVEWKGNDKVILRSSDIGDEAWKLDAEGRWKSVKDEASKP